MMFFAPYKAAAIAIGAALLITGIALYIHGAERAKAQVTVLEQRLDVAVNAARANSDALDGCKTVNAMNEAEAKKQATIAQAAEARTAEAEHKANIAIVTMQERIAQLRARGLECPAIDKDFREWLNP